MINFREVLFSITFFLPMYCFACKYFACSATLTSFERKEVNNIQIYLVVMRNPDITLKLGLLYLEGQLSVLPSLVWKRSRRNSYPEAQGNACKPLAINFSHNESINGASARTTTVFMKFWFELYQSQRVTLRFVAHILECRVRSSKWMPFHL